MIDRRRFVILLAGACLLEPLALRAQPAGKVFRIGLLIPDVGPTPWRRDAAEALVAGLRDLGWVEGKNLVTETRWAGTDPQRQREMAAELKALPVSLIIAPGTITIRAARDGAPGVPVVMVNAGDPVGAGLVASLARPRGDLTGTSAAGEEVLAKQVELLSAAVPQLKRVSVLMNSANPANAFFFDAMAPRAKTLGLQLDRIDVTLALDWHYMTGPAARKNAPERFSTQGHVRSLGYGRVFLSASSAACSTLPTPFCTFPSTCFATPFTC